MHMLSSSVIKRNNVGTRSHFTLKMKHVLFKILTNQRNLQSEQYSLEKGCMACFNFNVIH